MAIIVPVDMTPTIHALTTGVQTLYTCGSIGTTGKLGLLKSIDVTNTTAAPVTVTIHIVPPSGTPSASTALYFATSVAANSVLSWRGTQILAAGGTLQALASATGLTMHAAGGEYAPTV